MLQGNYSWDYLKHSKAVLWSEKAEEGRFIGHLNVCHHYPIHIYSSGLILARNSKEVRVSDALLHILAGPCWSGRHLLYIQRNTWNWEKLSGAKNATCREQFWRLWSSGYRCERKCKTRVTSGVSRMERPNFKSSAPLLNSVLDHSLIFHLESDYSRMMPTRERGCQEGRYYVPRYRDRFWNQVGCIFPPHPLLVLCPWTAQPSSMCLSFPT